MSRPLIAVLVAALVGAVSPIGVAQEVPPEVRYDNHKLVRTMLLATLAASGIPYVVLIEDVQLLIDTERQRLLKEGAATGPWFADFKDYDAVNAQLNQLVAVPGCESQDVNGDGSVNVLDLIDLLLLFGTSCP